MIYLYLKIHNQTNLHYLGKTKQDPYKYKGSGVYWSKHIKKHGYDVTTIVLYETPYNEEIQEQGLYYSNLWNIVDSKSFANLKPESGDGGGAKSIMSEESRRKISRRHKGKTISKKTRQKISDAHKGKKYSNETRQKISIVHKGKTVSKKTRQKISNARKGITFSESHIQKLRKPKQTVQCPHCGKIGAGGAMKQWHFDKCRNKPTS